MSRQQQNPISFIPTLVILLLSSILPRVTAAGHSVFVQKQYSPQLGQLVTSSTLLWESYINDPKQLEYAVEGGKVITEEQNHPIYVCRALIDGIYISGHTEKRRQKYVCIVSLLTEVKAHHAFDILINKGHLGKLSWKPWRKFMPGVPTGAVSVAGSNQGSELYVARHKVNHANQLDHEQEVDAGQYGSDYHLGRFDPHAGLGKVIVTENDRDKEYEVGEILIEFEPIRYELRDIQIDKWKLNTKVNQTELGSSILSNKGNIDHLVETVISYEYDKVQYWGTYEGLTRGLRTDVYEQRKLTPEQITWGLKHTEKIIETKTVSTNLKPGTALNVTLKGNYTSHEAPYTATLVSFYLDSNESMSRKISTTFQKWSLHDIRLDFSPIYWIDNGTMLPTTTTTTTTTTEATTTTTKEPVPVYSPPVVNIADIGSSSSSSSHEDLMKKHHDDMENSNDIAADQSRETHPADETVKMRNTAENKPSSGPSIQNDRLGILGCILVTTISLRYNLFY